MRAVGPCSGCVPRHGRGHPGWEEQGLPGGGAADRCALPWVSRAPRWCCGRGGRSMGTGVTKLLGCPSPGPRGRRWAISSENDKLASHAGKSGAYVVLMFIGAVGAGSLAVPFVPRRRDSVRGQGSRGPRGTGGEAAAPGLSRRFRRPGAQCGLPCCPRSLAGHADPTVRGPGPAALASPQCRLLDTHFPDEVS